MLARSIASESVSSPVQAFIIGMPSAIFMSISQFSFGQFVQVALTGISPLGIYPALVCHFPGAAHALRP
jgi:hypothetical protein